MTGMHSIVLPRIKARRKRRVPRGPWWWIAFAGLVVSCVGVFRAVIEGRLQVALAYAPMAVVWHRDLSYQRRREEDETLPVVRWGDRGTDAALIAGSLALVFAPQVF